MPYLKLQCRSGEVKNSMGPVWELCIKGKKWREKLSQLLLSVHHLQEKFRQHNSGNSWWWDYLRSCYGKTFQPKGIDYLGRSQDQSGQWWDSGHQARECSTSQWIQTLLNLLGNIKILRSVPDVRIPHMLLRRLIRAGKAWHKSCFWYAKWRNSLESITPRKKVKSIVKNAIQRTLGPKDFDIAKE